MRRDSDLQGRIKRWHAALAVLLLTAGLVFTAFDGRLSSTLVKHVGFIPVMVGLGIWVAVVFRAAHRLGRNERRRRQ